MRDYNNGRRVRASRDRAFMLCAYTFQQRAEIPLGVITEFTESTAGSNGDGPDSPRVIRAFMGTFLECVEPTCVVTETGETVATEDAWVQVTTIGDEYGPIGAETLAEIVQDLITGATDLPTAEPAASPDGSQTPGTGITSMQPSLSEAATLTPSTPDGV